jgi:AraC-like DNA-binding protein
MEELIMKSCEPYLSDASYFYPYSPSPQARRLFLYPIICGVYQYEPGYELHRESFDSFLFMYISQGSLSIRTNGNTFTAKSGQIVLIDCYQPHSYVAAEPCHVQWIHFDGHDAKAYFDYLSMANQSILFTPKTPQSIVKYLQHLISSFENRHPIREAYLHTNLTQLLCNLLTSCQDSDSEPGHPVEEMISYITEHLSEDLSLNVLAKHVSLSPYYLLRLFKKETGCTPHDYIIQARLNSAKFLLKTTQMSIKGIAYAVGFTSESVFCSAFKTREGISPGGYRKDA